MGRLLEAWGLRFRDAQEEREFSQEFTIKYKRHIQVAMLLGGAIYSIFFIWDRIIDPASADTTYLIRAAMSVAVWLLAALLSWSALDRFLEVIMTAAITAVSLGLIFIYAILANGFDYGAVGVVLAILFAFTLLPVRSAYYAAFCIVTFVSFMSIDLAADNSKPGMFVVNMLCVGTAVALGMFAAVMRERNARQQFLTAKQLDAAKNRVEELLHSMLPREIVKRIQAGETAIADAYGEVSIVFADLVGFTELSRRVSPGHLVELLSKLFSAFDAAAERYGVEKIKTIGDAYMAIGGISAKSDKATHAEATARFALALQQIVNDLSIEMNYPINVRIGLHVGPVVAGVIGVKRPTFDAWGEAVNLASRLEHNAAPGGILISESAYWRLQKIFPIKVLEEVNLKGIGPAKVFLLQPQPTQA